jgi:hypothetical protein
MEDNDISSPYLLGANLAQMAIEVLIENGFWVIWTISTIYNSVLLEYNMFLLEFLKFIGVRQPGWHVVPSLLLFIFLDPPLPPTKHT